VGKVLLSGLSPYELKKFVRKRGLEWFTEFTITDIDKLQNELDKIRIQGYASDEQEYVKGLRCVAVPIYNSKSEVTSALSIAGPLSEMKGREFEKRKQLLIQVSGEISGLLGHKGLSKKTITPDICFTMIVCHQGKEYRIKCRASENVYRAISRSGHEWAWSGCGGGGCGICKVQITAGSVVYRRMSCAHVTEAEKEQGIALACCIMPASDLELVICGV
jgi:ferredoxin